MINFVASSEIFDALDGGDIQTIIAQSPVPPVEQLAVLFNDALDLGTIAPVSIGPTGFEFQVSYDPFSIGASTFFDITISGFGFWPTTSLVDFQTALSDGTATGTLTQFAVDVTKPAYPEDGSVFNDERMVTFDLLPGGYTVTSGEWVTEVTGSLPTSIDDLRTILSSVVQLFSYNSLTPAEQAALATALSPYDVDRISQTVGGQQIAGVTVGTSKIEVALGEYTLNLLGSFPEDFGAAVPLVVELGSFALAGLLGQPLPVLDLSDLGGFSLSSVEVLAPDGTQIARTDGTLGVIDPTMPAQLVVDGLSVSNLLLGNPGPNDVPDPDDFLDGTAGQDHIAGLSGHDTLNGLDGDDFIFGGSGDDQVDGGAGDDRLSGDEGDDLLKGGAGADMLDGGAGIDTADYTGATMRTVIDVIKPDRNTGDAAGDTYVSIENILGSDRTDIIGGTFTANRIEGGGSRDAIFGRGGDDQLFGQEGDDILLGGAGADLIDGGEGIDRTQYTQARERVVVDLSDTARNEGEAIGDVFVSIEGIFGSKFDDWLFGDGGANDLFGDDGDDVLTGREGNDALFGGAGSDSLIGGAGDDVMRGGAAQDRFFYDGGADTIGDWRFDTIVFDSAFWGGGGKTGADILADHASVVGGDAVFDFGGGNTLTVENQGDLAVLEGYLAWFA